MGWDRVPVVELVPTEGLWGIRNQNYVPLGGLVQLRNATLEDNTWRTGGGAAALGTAIAGTPTIQAAIDYWPDTVTQRTVVSLGDGTLRKDNGNGAAWVTLVSGLTTTGQVAWFCLGGAEAAGRNRKVFHFDRVNAVRVLSGDGATMTVIASPPADWSGANQPGTLAVHQGYLWGGGNANAPHTLYRSLQTNHEDFLTTVYTLICGPEVGEERITALLSYKGGLLVWKYPLGVYFVDTSDPTPANWRVIRVGNPGAAGPGCVVRVEDDVIWISPEGTWHLISTTQKTGSVRAEDFSYRKLGAYLRDNLNLAQLATAQMVYYAFKQEVMLACHGQGQTAKNRRVHLDLNQAKKYGGRWIWWDRDRNEALFLRKILEVYTPAFGNNAGQLYLLDRTARNAAGSAYTFEWWTQDMDFSKLNRHWAGKWKNGRFLQVEHDPRGAVTHTIEIYLDGNLAQTITLTLTAGAPTLPVTLPFTLGPSGLALTRPRRLLRRFRRLSLRGYTTAVDADVSITRLLIGLELGE